MEGPSNWLRKGAWTAEEDTLLRQCIDKYGEGKWSKVPLRAGLNRCRKSCRLRWLNYLNPSIKKGKFSVDEVDLILRLHKLLGNRWALIAGRLPGRTANDIKNYWNTNLAKKEERERPKKHDVNGRNRLIGLLEIDHGDVNNLIFEESVWWGSFLRESHETDLLNSKATATVKGETSAHSSLFKPSTFVGEDKDMFVNNLMDGESFWWESLLLEESQETDVLMNTKATATEKGETSLDRSLFYI